LPEAILSPHLKSATPINRQHATNVGVRNYALLFFGCVLFHLAGTWSLPLIDRDEPRFAEASREMIERGDYVVPYFNDRVRFDKPPLIYWTQVTSYKIFGENDFAARFPSTIAAALTAVLLLAWGSRFGKTRVGWWAAIIFTLSLQTFVHAKAAVADMWLVLFVTLAHWAGYELVGFSDRRTAGVSDLTIQRFNDLTIERSWHWWWTFYFALAFAFLAKGPIGWTPLLTVEATRFFVRDAQLATRFKFVRGILLTLAIVALWGIPALIQTHGEFLTIGIGRHVIGRSFGAMEGHGANSLGAYLLLLPFYFVTIFGSFFPWSIKLPWLAKQLWRNRRAAVGARGYNARDATDNYLIAGSAIIFFSFTLAKTKLPHYTLPAFPLLALLLARMLAAENSMRFLRTCSLASTAVYLAFALVVPPVVARLFPAYELFQESHDYLRPEMQFASVDYNEPSLVWYFRSRIRGWLATPALRPTNVQRFMEQTGPRFVILPTDLAGKIYPVLPNDWKDFRARGSNIVKGKRVDLTLILKPE
jgi:4-amino-4-deoxy-L-arabinose transferase-like glycosyltransferase